METALREDDRKARELDYEVSVLRQRNAENERFESQPFHSEAFEQLGDLLYPNDGLPVKRLAEEPAEKSSKVQKLSESDLESDDEEFFSAAEDAEEDENRSKKDMDSSTTKSFIDEQIVPQTNNDQLERDEAVSQAASDNLDYDFGDYEEKHDQYSEQSSDYNEDNELRLEVQAEGDVDEVIEIDSSSEEVEEESEDGEEEMGDHLYHEDIKGPIVTSQVQASARSIEDAEKKTLLEDEYLSESQKDDYDAEQTVEYGDNDEEMYDYEELSVGHEDTEQGVVGHDHLIDPSIHAILMDEPLHYQVEPADFDGHVRLAADAFDHNERVSPVAEAAFTFVSHFDAGADDVMAIDTTSPQEAASDKHDYVLDDIVDHAVDSMVDQVMGHQEVCTTVPENGQVIGETEYISVVEEAEPIIEEPLSSRESTEPLGFVQQSTQIEIREAAGASAEPEDLSALVSAKDVNPFAKASDADVINTIKHISDKIDKQTQKQTVFYSFGNVQSPQFEEDKLDRSEVYRSLKNVSHVGNLNVDNSIELVGEAWKLFENSSLFSGGLVARPPSAERLRYSSPRLEGPDPQELADETVSLFSRSALFGGRVEEQLQQDSRSLDEEAKLAKNTEPQGKVIKPKGKKLDSKNDPSATVHQDLKESQLVDMSRNRAESKASGANNKSITRTRGDMNRDAGQETTIADKQDVSQGHHVQGPIQRLHKQKDSRASAKGPSKRKRSPLQKAEVSENSKDHQTPVRDDAQNKGHEELPPDVTTPRKPSGSPRKQVTSASSKTVVQGSILTNETSQNQPYDLRPEFTEEKPSKALVGSSPNKKRRRQEVELLEIADSDLAVEQQGHGRSRILRSGRVYEEEVSEVANKTQPDVSPHKPLPEEKRAEGKRVKRTKPEPQVEAPSVQINGKESQKAKPVEVMKGSCDKTRTLDQAQQTPGEIPRKAKDQSKKRKNKSSSSITKNSTGRANGSSPSLKKRLRNRKVNLNK